MQGCTIRLRPSMGVMLSLRQARSRPTPPWKECLRLQAQECERQNTNTSVWWRFEGKQRAYKCNTEPMHHVGHRGPKSSSKEPLHARFHTQTLDFPLDVTLERRTPPHFTSPCPSPRGLSGRRPRLHVWQKVREVGGVGVSLLRAVGCAIGSVGERS